VHQVTVCGACLQMLMDNNPFPDVVVSCFDALDQIDRRQQCTQCCRSRKYLCYTCLKPMPTLADKIPHVRVSISMFFLLTYVSLVLKLKLNLLQFTH